MATQPKPGSGDRKTVEPPDRVGQAAVEHVGQVVGQAQQAVGHAVEDIGSYIRSQREAAQVSMRQLARSAGVSNPYLSQVERGLRKPSAEILQQIAKGLRISAEALYVRAGILEERPAGKVTDAVLTDPTLSERQKRVLLDVYESFRRENGLPDDTPHSIETRK
ncbi:transcriptional regulator [Pseudonocardia sp. EC080610-09]|uniref:helix-turn-helix domain-containing protein n=1 Tax=unclassified Pseudonocardia TaxID=2619320 RepID=UPI0006CB0C3B|nr:MULTISPECIES: helix-turn-helix transcriptional regulator [unclassified Pseudonocardia]ALE75161.1 transcriptional regulator [Pseudonocardia sp. EC080625-04]ALL74525.1 transcriptional regulator [Pseudonocardia sp. EC080610-09]ALL81544.1 transcriptional regulator [Pseudonocardia sp. EC080619-01]